MVIQCGGKMTGSKSVPSGHEKIWQARKWTNQRRYSAAKTISCKHSSNKLSDDFDRYQRAIGRSS
jgi:hypothetical protein